MTISYKKPLETTDGRPVRFLTDVREKGVTGGEGSKFPYLCLVGSGNDRAVEQFNELGYAMGGSKTRLRNVPGAVETRSVIDTSQWRKGDKIPVMPNGLGYKTARYRRQNPSTGQISATLPAFGGLWQRPFFWNDDGSPGRRTPVALDTRGMVMKEV